jgi:peptide chain release factor 1
VRLGECSLEVEGADLSGLDNEPGGHRIQRVPPTERKGRVHTSTVTVAVIDSLEGSIPSQLNPKDLKIEWYSGTGAGGQNRNKVMCSCRLTHIPTGIVRSSQTRSRITSYDLAYKELSKAVSDGIEAESHLLVSLGRKKQVGTGMRGDKIRTYRFQDDVVSDHNTGKKSSVKKVLAGNFDMLW